MGVWEQRARPAECIFRGRHGSIPDLAARLRRCGFSDVGRSYYNHSEIAELRVDYRADGNLSL